MFISMYGGSLYLDMTKGKEGVGGRVRGFTTNSLSFEIV
jgi:hypothetical protein